MMTKENLRNLILQKKEDKFLSWEQIAENIGLSTVFTTSVCLGMNSFKEDQARKLVDLLNLPSECVAALISCPTKSWDKLVPQDPVIYRFYEVVGVYGSTMKEIIHEKFGDGIMSAIDFSMHIEKEDNPLGERVVITMNGKFLPYRSW